MEPHELIEKSHEAQEHEGGGGHGHGMSKYIGMTMATLGVVLALTSAMVGSARTALIATMVKQTNTALEYQSLSNKYRLMQAQLQQLHALLPDPKEFKKTEDEVHSLVEQSKGDPRSAVLAGIMTLQSKELLLTVTPTREDLMRFVDLMKQYNEQQHAAHHYTESFDDKIESYAEAAEHYEWAQLCCEIAIVLASVALLLGSRFAWLASLVPAAAGAVLIVLTFMSTQTSLTKADHEIVSAKAGYDKLIDEKAEAAGDTKLIHDIETGN